MKLRFDEKKTTDLATFLLRMSGGHMPYLKLLKLLYMADRLAFDRYGSPITGDYYVSMDYGPVLSRTYDMIKAPPEPARGLPGEIWNERIARDNYEVRLTKDIEPVLSHADREIAAEVFEKRAGDDQWTLAELTHEFPEWRDPKGSALPIDYEDILLALGKDREEARDILSRLSMKAYLQDHASKF